MNLHYYTMDDLRLGRGGFLQKGWTIWQAQELEEALVHYRGIPITKRKVLGLTDGFHVLELVKNVPLLLGDPEGEDVLASELGEPLPQWEAWLPDVSHRVRHGAARIWALQEGEGYSACAMAVALTPQEALLGGVAVLPEKRGGRLGSYLAAALCSALSQEGRAVYLFRRAGMHKQFYERMGFAPYGPPAMMMIPKGV